VNATPTKLRSISNGRSKIGSAPPATRALLKDTERSSPSSPVECPTPVDENLPVATSLPVSAAPRVQKTATTSAIRRQRAKIEEGLRSSDNPSSPPAKGWETEAATHVAIPKKTPGRLHKNTTATETVSAYQTTAEGKRKRLSVDVVENQTENDIEYRAVMSQRRQLVKDAARPCTPTLPVQYGNLDTPASLPALTPGSSIMSTPPIVKARAAGKKQRKIRTKRDFEQRVSPEKYDEIMVGRKSIAAAAENIVRGSTRSGRVRK
jgi:hypothetical protein